MPKRPDRSLCNCDICQAYADLDLDFMFSKPALAIFGPKPDIDIFIKRTDILIKRIGGGASLEGYCSVIRAGTEDQCDLGPEGWTEEECFANTISFLTDGPRDNWLTLPNWPDPAAERQRLVGYFLAFGVPWQWQEFRADADLIARNIDKLWGIA